MPQKIIVTPWNSYIDIDGLACAIAYAELLRYEWSDATAVFVGNMNASIPPFLQEIAKSYVHENIPWNEYVFVDISNKKFIESYIDINTVTEVYDHHKGDEEFWRDTLWEKAKIEPIWAAATLIWEEWKKRVNEVEKKISKESASLLAYAILSNTVNFQLSLTCERDTRAFDELEKIADLRWNWREIYFKLQQEYIEKNTRFAIENDIKADENFAFWQMEIWRSDQNIDFAQIFTEIGYNKWLVNLVDIEWGYSRILSNQPHLLGKLSATLKIKQEGSELIVPHIMLRKEIYPILLKP